MTVPYSFHTGSFNEEQVLSLSNDTLYLTGGSYVVLPQAGTGWQLTGNAGTDPAVNFIGTTDNAAFKIRVNKQQAGWLNAD